MSAFNMYNKQLIIDLYFPDWMDSFTQSKWFYLSSCKRKIPFDCWLSPKNLEHSPYQCALSKSIILGIWNNFPHPYTPLWCCIRHPSRQLWDCGRWKSELLWNFTILCCQWTVKCLLGCGTIAHIPEFDAFLILLISLPDPFDWISCLANLNHLAWSFL